MNTHRFPAKTKCLFVISVIKAARNVPIITAKKVNATSTPLAFEIFAESTSSGRIPYFEGPKIALCIAIRKSREYTPVSDFRYMARRLAAIITSSAAFIETKIFLLLSLSAKIPEAEEKRGKG